MFFFFPTLQFPAKNRTSSPSSASSQQPTNISGNKSSVSSSNLKRETSPTVCCYYINNSHSNRDAKSCQKARENNKNSANQVNCNRTNNNNNNNSNNNNNINNNCEQYHNEYIANDRKKVNASDRNEQLTRNISNNGENGEREQSENCENGYSYLKDKIRKFENTTNNHQNIKNRTTTTSSGVCGVSREINEYKNSCNEFQINRDESRLKAPSNECSVVSDSNNNHIIKVTKLQVPPTSDSVNKSSFNVKQLRDTKDSNFVNGVDGNDVKLTKVVILNKKSLAHGVSNHKQSALNKQTKVPKQNSLDDNDFSFIDSSSNELSVSSSSSFASDDLRHDLSDAFDKINHKKFTNRIPKINKSHNTKSSVDSNKVCEVESSATESVCDIRYRKFNNGNLVDSHEHNTDEKFLKLSPDNSTSSLNCFSRSNYQIYERISPDKTVTNIELMFLNCLSFNSNKIFFNNYT